MASAFGRKTPIMNSSEYTNLKKATTMFPIYQPGNDVDKSRAAVFSTPGVSDRIVISGEPSSSSVGTIRILNFVLDPDNPKRYVQNFR